MKEPITVKEGGMWEYPEFEIVFNYECSNYGGGKPCKHCHSEKTIVKKYGTKEHIWICPIIIIGKNEGGYNSVGICAQCLYDSLKNIIE